MPELPVIERRNWYIYLLYVRRDYDECKVRAAAEILHEEVLSCCCQMVVFMPGLAVLWTGEVQSCGLPGLPDHLLCHRVVRTPLFPINQYITNVISRL